jgi:type VI protein secretion system component Hcp
MSNSVAEAYLLIVRESNVPIFGEAVPMPFTGQIELDSWSWEIKNKVQDAKKKADLEGTSGTGAKGTKGTNVATGKDASSKPGANDEPLLFKPDALIRQVTDMQVKPGLSQKERDRRVQELIKKAISGHNDAASSSGNSSTTADDDEEGAMVLKFEKGVDLATTPMLFALARGDIMPKAILTLFHRAKNAPVTLAITMGDIRLKSYEVSCDPDDKMADLKEKWEATYQTIDWMYQNRPAAAGPNFLTQGTVRVFVMQQETLPV